MSKQLAVVLTTLALLFGLCIRVEARLQLGVAPDMNLVATSTVERVRLNGTLLHLLQAKIHTQVLDEGELFENWLARFQHHNTALAISARTVTDEPVSLTFSVAESHKIEKRTTEGKRLTLITAVVILLAAIMKLGWLLWRWKQSQLKTGIGATVSAYDSERLHSTLERGQPSVAPATDQTLPGAAEALAEPRTWAGLDGDKIIIEAGRLGPGTVPALLKRCADLTVPVTLYVRNDLCEKHVHFAAGQVVSAYSEIINNRKSVLRWKKLGNLLIGEDLVTEEECRQGLELVDRKPGLRLGQALLRLRLIDLASLRYALTRQSQEVIYSLILFPEGDYTVMPKNCTLPPEENVSLEIRSMLREAARHQAEWTAIRKALPTLDTVVDYHEGGRQKAEQVRFSVHQQTVLSLIDGHRTINDLSTEASMPDYDLFRFLFMMMRSGVLTTATATPRSPRRV